VVYKEVAPSKRLIILNSLIFKALSTYSEVFLCYLGIWFLTFGIRAQGLGVSLLHLRHIGILNYNFFFTTFQKEPLGKYLLDGSRYIGLKFHLPRPYTFGYITCVR
jgi:hypothetical protein